MGNPHTGFSMTLFGKESEKSFPSPPLGLHRFSSPTSMVSYNSVTYNKRSDALSIRLRLSHRYGCLSKDLCLYSWTIDLSTSTREKRRSGVSVIKSTKWKSQQQNSRKSTNDLNQPSREKKMKSKKYYFVSQSDNHFMRKRHIPLKPLFLLFYLRSFLKEENDKQTKRMQLLTTWRR